MLFADVAHIPLSRSIS